LSDITSDIIDTSLTYRQGFRNLVRVVQVQALIIVMLTGFLFYCVRDVVPQDTYFAETSEGSRMQLVSLDDPNVNMDALTSWAEQAAVDVLTFGFNDIDKRFEHSQRYFTIEGWKTFALKLADSALLRNVTTLQQMVSTIPREPAEIISWGYKNGKYSWIVRVPLIMTTRAGKTRTTQGADVTMTIIKLPTSENPRGIAIDSWVSR
jgi:intracellular multiplication protein IcmL